MSDAANILCLPLIAPEVAYLSALVLVPSANVLAAVDAVRRAHRIDDAVVDPPHVTLLFLGRPPGRLLLELHAALHAASTVRPRAETAGMAVFRSNGLVTNIHLRLAPNPALEQAHGMLLDTARKFAWFAPGPFAGASYLPHISIYDRISLDPAEARRIIDTADWKDLSFTLGDAHVRAVPLSPV